MTNADLPSDALTGTAREDARSHAIGNTKPAFIPAWRYLDRMTPWLDDIRDAAGDPTPETARAAEWILDNQFRLRRTIRQIGEDLPADFYNRLPGLSSGKRRTFPRVYAMAHELLRATHLQLSLGTAVQYVDAYQDEAPLNIGELWAFPIMLRLACLDILIEGCAVLFPHIAPPFPAPEATYAFDGLDETERVARALANLGIIDAIPWKIFFDRTSRVERILSDDPAATYARMDFETRDQYRKVVENLAHGAERDETAVAEAVVGRARGAAAGRRAHVGYWLLADGRLAIEEQIGYRPPPWTWVERRLAGMSGTLYVLAMILASAGAMIVPAIYLAIAGAGLGHWLLGMLLIFIPATVLGITLVHWLVTLIVPPHVLPKLDFEKGIPTDCGTVVSVPVIVKGVEEVPRLLERIETHKLANPDPSLRFAILADLADADSETLPEDEEVEHALVEGVRALNRQYAMGEGAFYLLLRPRRYNPSEGVWMGWERKRGKLEQFNRLLLGEDGSETGFTVCEGDVDGLKATRFVVTVDADTSLPPGAVARLVGTLAHPLNSAQFDAKTGRVVSGYTIVQPRVEISPESGSRSIFARFFVGNTAIDIYTRAVSDVYQDLFGAGIYVGKGIYEVASFHKSLEGRVPENRLVSHDLFEGVHGRAALATDIILYEDFPTGYVQYARRWHRWVRGDWQLLPWLGRRVPTVDGEPAPNPLPLLARWKFMDNLRRSLVPLSLFALCIAGWLSLPGSPWIWTVLTVAAPGGYLFTDLVTGLARGSRRGVTQSLLRRLRDHAGRWVFAIVFLVHDAMLALDAILRTLWRLFVSKRRLLEWTSAAHDAGALAGRQPRAAAWRYMWPAPAISLLLAADIALLRPAALWAAAPLLLMWFLSPEIAVFISRPARPARAQARPEDRTFLRRLARRTWLYFETFAGPSENWLPPDNFQETPHADIAHRTSPTNIGMMFVSALGAWDMGHTSSSELAARLENSLDSLERLRMHWGHVLNWYDTESLEPLEPRYVSVVDSGNLAVSLLTLMQGCEEAANAPALRPAAWEGLDDTLGVLGDAIDKLPIESTRDMKTALAPIAERVEEARTGRLGRSTALAGIADTLLPALAASIADDTRHEEGTSLDDQREVRIWLERIQHHVKRMQGDIAALAPWLPLVEAPPEGADPALRDAVVPLVTTAMSAIDEPAATALERLRQCSGDATGEAIAAWVEELVTAIESGCRRQRALCAALREIGGRAETLAFGMDFRPLFDTESRLFHIGYNVTADRLDPSHYDLLASEARLASFFAIAKGDVGVEHWFHLGRPMTQASGGLALVSWNGSMFEYLMPLLLQRSGTETLLAQSERAVVAAQQKFGAQHNIPWGVSESGFAALDPDHHYRYRSFGVPELGMRRELSSDIVITPYASALALAVRPDAAADNLRALDDMGIGGTYGLYEAADFTPERVPPERDCAIVRSYMAHHQGMLLGAIDNLLFSDVLVRRFRAHPSVRAVEFFLQERVPWELPSEVTAPELEPLLRPDAVRQIEVPRAWTPVANLPYPQMHALGNGRMASWISESGGGGIVWKGNAVTRWRPDCTRDADGVWIFVRDEDEGALWSAARQPSGITPEDSYVVFHPHMAEFHRRDHGISLHMEVGVVPDDSVEFRRITLTNESPRSRTLTITSYGEVVLAPPADDERHTAFSKLFVGSEYVPEQRGILFTRRPRHAEDTPPVMLHRVIGDEEGVDLSGYETDRLRFLGRNRGIHAPRGVIEGLSGSTGWRLDAVMAIEVRVTLKPKERRQFAYQTLVDESREAVMRLAARYATLSAIDWALDDARVEIGHEARLLQLEPDDLPELQKLASLLAYQHPAMGAPAAVLMSNRLGQPELWRFGISGDYPILLVRVRDPDEMGILRVLVGGHKMWRKRGINVDLVVISAGAHGYVAPMRDQLLSLLQEIDAQEMLGRDAGLHLVLGDDISDEDRRVLEATAGAILDNSAGSLREQLAAAVRPRPHPIPFGATTGSARGAALPALPEPEEVQFANGTGGFSADGGEYVIRLEPGQTTPAPWCNVLANDEFGTIVTEAGGGFTWGLNSGENRLTPWTNDAVIDTPTEVVYLRDEESAEVWTPTPRPAGEGATSEIRHGIGYTTWRRHSHGLVQDLTVFVPPKDPVKIARLTLNNPGERVRRITATYYAEWLLGAMPSVARRAVVGWYAPDCHALMARNPWNVDFANRVAFLTATRAPHSLTTDRQDFLGREGSLHRPEAMEHWDLGGHTGPGVDPCAAFQVHLDVPPRGTAEVAFVLGQGADQRHAEELARRWQDDTRVADGFTGTRSAWTKRLGTVQATTPDPAFDLMINRWLPYQVQSSRLMARAGFYQAGGAYGFRDQLQDVMALVYSDPSRIRAHILEAASHQFEQGDVLHWWHPPADRGVRTRCSDDLLWLPYVTSAYVTATGDESILNEKVPFLVAPLLNPGEHDHYARYDGMSEPRPLFEHCERALDFGVTAGEHGLPLMGSGDWNDGMDRVGAAGRGESVWLGWFAMDTMRRFAELAQRMNRQEMAARWRRRASRLESAIEDAAWDGAWYVRAFDDEGKLWGSTQSDDCRIDSIAQSWSVLARESMTERAAQALESAYAELVRPDDRIACLLWPPFDQTPRDPGYIKGYPPGIRENGGQYSHAAAWLGHAFAKAGDGKRAKELFDILNPINHARTAADSQRYRVEPYAVAADIAGVAPHVGRGGWTWYTGAAAWTWRLGVEALLGLRLEKGRLVIDPCLPPEWGGAEATVKGETGTLQVVISDPDRAGAGDIEIVVDGKVRKQQAVAFPTGGTTRRVEVRIKPKPQS